MTGITIRTIDGRGRLTLGPEFANPLVIVKAREDDALEVIPAEAIPARESWLYKNPEALAAVMEGLEQAKAGKLVEGPDLQASSSFADGIEDE